MMRDTKCEHLWEAHGGWGVIVGVSRCRRCGRLSRSEDFPASAGSITHSTFSGDVTGARAALAAAKGE